MKMKLVLALGLVAVVAAFSGAAMADNISFNFASFNSSNPHGTLTATSGSSGTFLLSTFISDVHDTDTDVYHYFGPSHPAVGTTTLTAGSESAWSFAGSFVTFQYDLGGSVQVWDGAILLVSGNMLGAVSDNPGFKTGTKSSNGGSASGGFTVSYLNPIIYTWLGLGPQTYDPTGNWSVTTKSDTCKSCTATSGTLTAQVSEGSVTIFTSPVPEPGTLAMFGTGILGLAGLIRRKY